MDYSQILKFVYFIPDFSIPSIPESVTDVGVMDGIIPLSHSNVVAGKPIDQLKNELIADFAEVFFDPIVPLPSPSKVRPKLRPVPRLGPHRRNSVQVSRLEKMEWRIIMFLLFFLYFILLLAFRSRLCPRGFHVTAFH